MPSADFERQWRTAGGALRRRLRAGERVVLHCKGGLGRTGMIAARLLVELGAEPAIAMGMVRTARRGAIENGAQELHVFGCFAAPGRR